MRHAIALGAYGERVAVRYLLTAGLEIVDRNWRSRHGEIDIVAREGRTLVVVEVKTRSSAAYGDPAEAVVGAKAARLRRLADQWCEAHPGGWDEVRVDVISVLRPRSGPAGIAHLRAVA